MLRGAPAATHRQSCPRHARDDEREPKPCRSTQGSLWWSRSELDGRLLYILPDAVTAHSIADGERGGDGAEPNKAPVPPCILPLEDNTTQISLEVDDRSPAAALTPPQHQCCLCLGRVQNRGMHLKD